jgi:predicted negative regulator of RcsB-dependent stress response
MHHVKTGDDLLTTGQVEEAAVEYHRANHASPNHPRERLGLARVAAARGHYTRALALYRALLSETPTAEVATAIGDILSRGGDTRGASEMYARAETLTRK